MPSNVKLLCILRGSITLLLVSSGCMKSSYLIRYLVKGEEHGPATLSAGPDGKSFKLPAEGAINSKLATVRHWVNVDGKR